MLPAQTEPVHLTTKRWYRYWTLEKSLALKPDTRYRFSCVFRTKDLTEVKAGGGLRFAGWNGKWFDVPGEERYVGTMDWTYRAYEFMTPKTIDTHVRKCYIGPDIRNAEGEAWVECIALEEVR